MILRSFLNMQKSKKNQTEWNLGMLYRSPQDPALMKDVRASERAHIEFEKKYKDRTDYLETPAKLKKALEEFETLGHSSLGSKPFVYLSLYKRSKPDPKGEVEGLFNKISEISRKSSNRVLFFFLGLGKVSHEKQKEFLSSPILKDFHYHLDDLFRNARYQLSESEEKILTLKSKPASSLWSEGVAKQVKKITVRFQGKDIPFGQASSMLTTLSLSKRKELYEQMLDALEPIGDFAESELNALCINKKINDELRGFDYPYQSVLVRNDNDPKVVKDLVKVVTDSFPLAHKFFTLKARMLKLSKLGYQDRNASVGKLKKNFDFNESVLVIRQVFEKLNPEYASVVDRYIANGQIDVFPRKDKESGAFCWTVPELPTYVLLNHVSNFGSVTTFAHEMGHAIHGELSKKQRLFSQGHSTSVAEVASTLFEMFVFEELCKKLSPRERVIALHDKIQDDIMTVFRQIACFNFEDELHTKVRAKGFLPKEEIAQLMNKHMSAYLGPVFKFQPRDGLSFISWSHIRNFFYVYSYAYGQLISKALFMEYKKDPKYLKKIEEFLSAGQSKSPEDIFESVGIPIRGKGFFKKGIEAIERDIKELERLLKEDGI